MCLLIASPSAEPVELSTCIAATRSNMDGFGIAYLKTGGVGIRKYQYLDPRDQARLIRKAAKRGPYIVHWRLACAQGGSQPVNKRLAHPFRLSPGAAIAHNGILPIRPEPGESDTSTLVAALIATGATSAAAAIDAIACSDPDSIGWNKFAALCHKGDIYIHGEAGGHFDDFGNWHSNLSGMRQFSCLTEEEELELEDDDMLPPGWLPSDVRYLPGWGLPQDVDEEFQSFDWRLMD